MPSVVTEPVTAAGLIPFLDALAGFSAQGPGVTRRAYDDAWCDAHLWLQRQARMLGFAATPDAAGNLLFHGSDVGPHAPALLVGSHLDSVAHGGRLDGAYGLACGFLLVAELREAGALPVVGFATCEEEESRFPGALMGARSLIGQAEARELDAITDERGVTWRAALAGARVRGCAAAIEDDAHPFAPRFAPRAALEIHIEQGPVLEREGLQLGIVEHIAGYRRMRLEIAGEARHSGTTPMRMRHDALAAAAEMVLAVEALGRDAGESAVATAGVLVPEPGLYNVVPGHCALGVEVRHVDAARLEALAAELLARCRAIATRRRVHLESGDASGQEPTALSPELSATAQDLAQQLGIPHRRMASGAAHDTMVFARAGIPALMLFVPSRGGISHSPDESTAPDQLVAGYRFLVALARRLAERPPR